MEVPEKTKRTLVIGLGNPWAGDDAFGSRVVERLRRQAPDSQADAELADAHTDLLGQIGRFPAYERVVLVDAILDPAGKLGNVGRVVLLEEESLSSWPESSPSMHQLSPLLAIRLFRRLNPHATTQIFLVGLCTDRLALPSATDEGCRALSEEAVTTGAGIVRALLDGEDIRP